MTGTTAASRSAGLLGPVAFSGGLALLLAAPLMRGGNRHVALIALEIFALAVLLAWWWNAQLPARHEQPPVAPAPRLLALLLFSPLLVAAVQLLPLPAPLWDSLPGRAVYAQAQHDAGIVTPAWRALSVSPDATLASLLAGLPLVAALLLGYAASLAQLRMVARLVVALAFAEVLLGLLQIFGGQYSPLYFGAMTYGPPIGTFANRNHYANYIAMALALYVWLAYEAIRDARSGRQQHAFGTPHRAAAWIAGSLVLVLGILMSRSRGATVFGLSAAVFAFTIVTLRLGGWSRAWRFAAPVTLLLVTGATTLIGFDAVTARLSGDQVGNSAEFRALLARTSLEGAWAFWPWGSGWGTYDLAYPRSQPASIAGYANHAHQDYVEMLFEGGIFFVLPALAFAALAAQRARKLVRSALHHRKLDREAMAAALCGAGLLGLLLHSLVEFNLRIPANAILGALLAGVYLRPLPAHRPSLHDRPAQPHPAGH